MRRASLFVLTLGLALRGTAAPIVAVDDSGATIELAQPARRIVSLAPNTTELLYAIGAGARIVGVVDTSDFPPEARSLPRVGNAHAIDLERIVSLRPDLVVTWPYTTPAQVGQLRARGIAVYVSNPATIDGIADDLEGIGRLAGQQARAGAAAAELRRRHAQLAARHAHDPMITVFYEIWSQPLYTIGGKHLITQALATCGARNVFDALSLPAPAVGVEAVLAASPEAIVAGADDAARPPWLDEWRRWSSLPAVAYGNLLAVDANLLHRPGPRFLDGVAQLCDVLAAARANRSRATASKTKQ